MPAILEYHWIVSADEIDGLGHVNNVAYVKRMQDAAVAHSAAQGWDTTRYVAEGAAFVAKSHFIEYHKPAQLGDVIVVLTWVSEFGKATSRRKYRMERMGDATLLATAETVWAYVSRETGLPKRIPPELLQEFETSPGPE